MKTAVMYFGFMRSFKRVAHLFMQNLIDPHNTDVFVFAPNICYERSAESPFNSQEKPDIMNAEYLRGVFGERLKACEIYEYSTKPFMQRVIQGNLPEKNFMGALSWRSLSMFHGLKKVIEMRQEYERKHNIKYDRVILSRPDIEVVKKVELDELDLGIVNYSISHSAPIIGFKPNEFGDHFLASKSENIDVLAELQDKVKLYHRFGICINNETLMGYHLMQHKIPVKKSDFVLHGVVR